MYFLSLACLHACLLVSLLACMSACILACLYVCLHAAPGNAPKAKRIPPMASTKASETEGDSCACFCSSSRLLQTRKTFASASSHQKHWGCLSAICLRDRSSCLNLYIKCKMACLGFQTSHLTRRDASFGTRTETQLAEQVDQAEQQSEHHVTTGRRRHRLAKDRKVQKATGAGQRPRES